MIGRRGFVFSTAAALAATARGSVGWALPPAGPVAGPASDPDWRPNSALLQAIPRMLELASVPGVAIAVIERGDAVARGVGRRSEGGTAITRDTLFEGASLGKPLVAYGTLRLADSGELDLDRPLHSYVRTADADNPAMRKVTARHVLTHTTGLPNWRRAAGPLLPQRAPGSEFTYSGEGFFHLQRVLERLTRVPFARWMRETVLEPLGMTNSSYAWLPEFGGRMATGHDADGEPREMYAAIGRAGEAIASKWHKPMLDWTVDDALKAVTLVNPQWPAIPLYAMPNAACSFLTTAADYSRFLARLVTKDPARRLELAPATLAAMTRPAVKLNSALSWGLGWGIQRDENGEVLWHWGANMSFRNFVVADQANGRAVAVLTNSENGPRVYERIITAVTGHDHPSFLWI